LYAQTVIGSGATLSHISVHADTPTFAHLLEDRLRGYNDSAIYSGKQTAELKAQQKQCLNQKEQCQASSHICHYITPDAINKLHGAVRELVPDQFREL
jgi:hypothetical protein